MRPGIPGTDHVALLLAAAWEKAGYDITLRSPQSRLEKCRLPVKTRVEAATDLLRHLGWTDDGSVDPGGIDSARGAKSYIVMFVTRQGGLKIDAFSIGVVRLER